MTHLRGWLSSLPISLAWRMVATATAERDAAEARAARAELERDAAKAVAAKAVARWRREHVAAEQVRADLCCWLDEHPVRGDQ